MTVDGIHPSRLVGGVYTRLIQILIADMFVIPHRASEDDVYEGYTIPGGSFIMPNLWYASSCSSFIP